MRLALQEISRDIRNNSLNFILTGRRLKQLANILLVSNLLRESKYKKGSKGKSQNIISVALQQY